MYDGYRDLTVQSSCIRVGLYTILKLLILKRFGLKLFCNFLNSSNTENKLSNKIQQQYANTAFATHRFNALQKL